MQLRMKCAEADVLESTAREVQALCRGYGATFIVDDDVMLAKRIGADGVHLGKEDMPIRKAREILGSEYIIGATVNSFDDIVAHLRGARPDYFGCGPFRFTTTKERLAPTLGVEGYRNIVAQMRSEGITIPLVAIGGITKSDVPDLLALGLSGIALSGSVLSTIDPRAEMRDIVDIITQNKL